MFGGADIQAAERVIPLDAFFLRAAQERLDAGKQLHHAEGFRDVIVRAAVKAEHLVKFRALCGKHDDGDAPRAGSAAQALEHGKAILLRQHDVEQHERRNTLFQRLPKGRRPLEALRLKPLAVERINDEFPDAVVILEKIDHAVLYPLV